MRIVLAEALRGVVAQQLLRKKGGGRVAGLRDPARLDRPLQRDPRGQDLAINNQIQTGKSKGMISMDQSLTELVKQRHRRAATRPSSARIDKETLQDA